ncbi:MAG: YgcG family protein, partial [Microcystaceae cyanobacterium]
MPAWATGVYDLPRLAAGTDTYLVDQAEAISLANEGKLNGDLKRLAQKTGQEVRFVVIRRLDFDNTIDVTYHDGCYDSPQPISDGTWHHAVATWETG